MNKNKRFSNYLKLILSHSPLFTLFIMFSSIMYLSILISNLPLEIKGLSTFIYISIMGFYFTGALKNTIWYFVSLVILIVLVSLTSLYLEAYTSGITGVYLPASFFLFFFSGFLMEMFKLNSSQIKKTIYSFLLTLLNIIFVIILFVLKSDLNPYFSLVIPITISVIFGLSIWFVKDLKKMK